ncbi:MAG: DNA primase family protein [Janthinobacterium lividum]
MTPLHSHKATTAASPTPALELFYDRPGQSITQLFQQEAAQVAAPVPPLPHEQVLACLLEQVEPVDFRERAGLRDDRDKLTTMHYTVITIREVQALAERNDWNLTYCQGFLHSYNGSYWKHLDEVALRYFLRQAANRLGVPDIKADYHGFVENLYKQFLATASLPAPAPTARKFVSVNLQNGTYDIGLHRQGLRAAVAADFLTHELPFAYDPAATAPRWKQFLDRVVPDEALQHVLAEYLAYVFIPAAQLKLEKVLLLYGTGANGKSVFFEVLTALLGPENVSNYSLSSLTKEPAYSRAHLATKLVNYASELNGKLEADTFKQLASGEPVEARLPYGQPFIMSHYAKLIFNCNELPTEVEHTNAFFRRFLIVPFSVTIPEAEQDKTLAATIVQEELAGVFNWILAGLHRLLEKRGFTHSTAIEAQLEAYKKQADTVRLFLEDASYIADPESWVKGQEVYGEYKFFCQEDGYRPVGRQKFTTRLSQAGIEQKRNKQGQLLALRKDFLAGK